MAGKRRTKAEIEADKAEVPVRMKRIVEESGLSYKELTNLLRFGEGRIEGIVSGKLKLLPSEEARLKTCLGIRLEWLKRGELPITKSGKSISESAQSAKHFLELVFGAPLAIPPAPKVTNGELLARILEEVGKACLACRVNLNVRAIGLLAANIHNDIVLVLGEGATLEQQEIALRMEIHRLKQFLITPTPQEDKPPIAPGK